MIPQNTPNESCCGVTTHYRRAWGHYLMEINRDQTAGNSASKAHWTKNYEIPNPVDSSLQYIQYYHLDLAEFPVEALHREKRRVQHVLDYADRPAPWLLERLYAIRQAMAERQRGPEPTPALPASSPYHHRQNAQVDRFKRQLTADPYFSQPERQAQGIPAAAIVVGQVLPHG